MIQMEDGMTKKESITIKTVSSKLISTTPEKAQVQDQAKVI